MSCAHFFYTLAKGHLCPVHTFFTLLLKDIYVLCIREARTVQKNIKWSWGVGMAFDVSRYRTEEQKSEMQLPAKHEQRRQWAVVSSLEACCEMQRAVGNYIMKLIIAMFRYSFGLAG